uniref:Uncharacterized protein n=1 Tax=Pavo cristatus TaxID=9049 RepID=A0A8C9FU32_PAVCR
FQISKNIPKELRVEGFYFISSEEASALQGQGLISPDNFFLIVPCNLPDTVQTLLQSPRSYVPNILETFRSRHSYFLTVQHCLNSQGHVCTGSAAYE